MSLVENSKKKLQEIRDSLVARITACRVVDRGSIPRLGAFLRKWFSGKIQRCHRWAPGSIPGLRIFFLIVLFLLVLLEIIYIRLKEYSITSYYHSRIKTMSSSYEQKIIAL